MWLIRIYCFIVLFNFNSTEEDDVVVKLPSGKIRGLRRTSYDGTDYYAFEQIPFAAPPIGKDRFKEPKSPEPWDGVLNTTRCTKQCIQESDRRISLYLFLEETEDCLFINVYSPQTPGSDNLLSVLVYIHGGAYLKGSGSPVIYTPGRFMDYNVVLVTFNYRLGALGFLTTGDDVIPGNLGLKDQLFALKWVNANIHLFGGDSEKVTLVGLSSGAYAAGFHLLSEATSGLFRACIQQSGSALSPMSYSPKARVNAFNLGKAVDANFSSEKSEDLLELLLYVPADQIVAASRKVIPADDNSAGYVSRLKWLPVIESETAKNPFITAPMHESYMVGKFRQVPVLLGFNSEEALLYLDASSDYLGGDYDKNPSLLIDSELNVAPENATALGKLLKGIYTNSSFSEDKAALIKYSSDAGFTTAALRQAELSAAHVPVYLYQFSYMGTLGLFMNFNRYSVPGAEGAGHAEELMYLWSIIPSFTHGDILTTKRLFVMWTNFIKYLNPTPRKEEVLQNITWPPLQNDTIHFLNINETLTLESDPRYYSKVKDLLLEYIQPPYNVF